MVLSGSTSALLALGLAFALSGCPGPGTGEGEGEGAAAGEGEGEGEGGGCAERTLGCLLDGTVNSQSNCCETTDVCVPLDNSTTNGVCRQKCGELTADGQVSHTLTGACDDATLTCQTVTPLPDGTPAAIACIAPGANTDSACRDQFDDQLVEQACPANEDCQPTTQDTAGFGSFNCKLACDPTDADSVARCTAVGQTCINVPADIPAGFT
ncbi:MAG TPA: hypothetical protein VGO62_14255, partial [Myxococcota bacterium]